MMKELATSFKAILYDRVVSPLSGAFIISWLILNWKIVVILILGNTPIIERIKVIEDNYLGIKTLFLNPALSTLFLILIYPWVSNIAYWIWQRALVFKVNTKIKFESSTPLTLEQSIELRKEIQRKDYEFTELLAGKNEKIQEQNQNIAYLNKLINESKTEIIELKNSPNKQITNPNNTQHETSESNYEVWHNEFNERLEKGTYLQNHIRRVIDETLGTSKEPLDKNVLRYFVSADIVEVDESTGKLSLTKKGKYFANLWTIDS